MDHCAPDQMAGRFENGRHNFFFEKCFFHAEKCSFSEVQFILSPPVDSSHDGRSPLLFDFPASEIEFAVLLQRVSTCQEMSFLLWNQDVFRTRCVDGQGRRGQLFSPGKVHRKQVPCRRRRSQSVFQCRSTKIKHLDLYKSVLCGLYSGGMRTIPDSLPGQKKVVSAKWTKWKYINSCQIKKGLELSSLMMESRVCVLVFIIF